ncbi:FAD-dependent oxidoreductase [Bradyrhizobium cajani]|uniref:NAD(P)-binding protein n=1 Tax=Bradyrhizobium cajani TaxID=1928661 RepID=A0A844TSA2_9BRAD|nr:NAD(P)/FAD-dependent oxidoreductase [Bradyrhizobium cajani]MCP3369441.1 FAD-dependent monooxygenase [Bradyrhizobium cajani]MVT77470.1 NAD(P)-binding protein [Bradyrhizobium cajani]
MTADRTVTETIAATETATIVADIAVVGGGLAGSLAAAVLARAGHRVALIDKRAIYPDEFRVEKIGGHQLEILRRLGFIGGLESVGCPYDRVLNIREGKVVDVSVGRAYGLPYADLVAMARRQMPDPCSLIVDEVTAVRSSDDVQHLELASGRRVNARLVVLATGMAGALGYKLGIRRRVLAERHSVSFGFTIARRDGAPFDFEALTCYGERTADGIDYLSLFPVPGGMRANLFMFRDPTDPVMRDLRRETEATVLRLLPGLQPYLGDFRVTDRIQNWVMDLSVVEGHLQAGVVLIGDAFQTNCPAAGTGVARLLTDVERLCTEYAPRWLMTEGMGREKISEFYADRDKVASDQHSLKMARFRQALTSRDDIRWDVRRRLHFLRRSITHRVDQMRPGWLAHVRTALRA